MPYPYYDLAAALGRPLTPEELAQANDWRAYPEGGPTQADDGRAIAEPGPTQADDGQAFPENDPIQAIPPNQPGVGPQAGPGTPPGVGPPTGPGLPSGVAPPPAFDAPQLVLPEQLRGPDPYTGLTAEQLAQDPSYLWRLDQGRKALEASRAAAGTIRGGAAARALVDYGQHAASTEYAAADARNRANYELNWGVKTGTYDRNVDAADRDYSARFQGAAAEYAPRMAGWQKDTDATQRNAELLFDRDWQKEIYNRDDVFRQYTYNTDDAYRKMVFMADDDFRKVVYGTDDAFRKAVQAENDQWKREVMAEERRRWLAELGASQ